MKKDDADVMAEIAKVEKDIEDVEDVKLGALELAKRKIADEITDFAIEEGVEVFYDVFKEPYLILPDKPTVAFEIASSEFRRWLMGRLYKKFKKGFSGETFSQVAGSLEGKAASENTSRILYNRVARVEDIIYYDLGDKIGRAHV